MNDKFSARDDTASDPPTDPAQALRDAVRMLKEWTLRAEEREREIHDVNTTLILTKNELAQLRREWQAAIDKQEAHEMKKHSLVKAFRDALSKLVGDIDTHVLKK